MDIQYFLSALAGILFGFAIGFLIVGYLIKPAIANWEGSESLKKLVLASLVFLGGGGLGAGLAANFSTAPQYYLIGIAAGIVSACFHKPVLIVMHTRESVLQVLGLSDLMQGHPRDMEQRAMAILAILAPPKSSKKSVEEVGSNLGTALDSFAEELPTDEDE